MSIYVNTLSGDLSTDAAARALWGWVDGKLQGDGWSYVAQTGDGDPNTMATGSNSTYPTFRVYSTTANSETWYMRLDYGHTSLGPSVKCKWGTGVNGSGTLTGQLSAQTTLVEGSGMNLAGQLFYISIAAGRFMYAQSRASFTGSGNPFGVLTCHMEVGSTGAMSSGMYTAILWGSTGSCPIMISQSIPISGTVPTASAFLPVICDMSSQTVKTLGNRLRSFFPMTWYENSINYPNPAIMICGTAEAGAGFSTYGFPNGVARRYMTTGLINPLGGGSNGGNAGTNRICFLWE